MSRSPPPDPTEEDAASPHGGTLSAETDARPRIRTPRTTLGLLQWGGEQLRSTPALVAPFAAAALAVTAAEVGITTVDAGGGTVPRFAAWVWPVYLLSFLVGWVGLGAIFLAAAEALGRDERGYVGRLAVAAERTPSMLVAGVVGAIPVAGGLLALVVPGVYLAFKFAYALPACAVDGLSSIGGLRRSFAATSGDVRPVLGLVAAFAALELFSSFLITALFARGGPELVGPLLQNLLTAVAVPLFSLAFGRLYASPE